MSPNTLIYASYLNSYDDEKVIKYLIGWSNAFTASIDMISISEKHNLKRNKERLLVLKEKLIKEDSKIPIDFHIKEGETAKIINEYRALTEADLLVLTTHRKGFWAHLFEPAITQQIAKETLIPLLVLKQK